ncbi:hypothetical protein QJS10_CPA02g00717 [Acorus calamus]|uniref:Uncharacterized protein n=1 Tax=Acorus calamus TaxID=4465 RepID=A0AAV9FCA1_ACOCL|nr:hypothetical protein QJS10_CPA02g00717 [Acorus calamus]
MTTTRAGGPTSRAIPGQAGPRNSRLTPFPLGRVGPRGLLWLQSLHFLSLSNNFTGALSPDLTRLNSLRIVNLSNNALSGRVPDEFFRKCGSLRSMSLTNNAFNGELPPSLRSCASLAYLNF